MFNENMCILKSFDGLVVSNPKNKAIKYNNVILAYKDLDVLINKIANFINFKLKIGKHENRVQDSPNITIPILIDKSHFTVASILAIWKLGLSCVVIDKRASKIRIEFLLNQIDSDLIIDDDFINELDGLHETFEKPVTEDNYIKSKDLACVCFTSGTTGTPKGVMINYKQICIASKNISMVIEKFLSDSCAVTLIPSFSTIAANIITFGVMFSNGYLHIISDEKVLELHYLIEYMKKNKITGSMFPPQLAEKFLKYADGLLKALVVSTDKASNLYSSKTIIVNLYGQTETLGFNTFFIIDKPYKDTPIGKPVDSTQIYLLDDNLKEVKKDKNNGIGEICVSKQLAIGYFDDEKLTKGKFMPNPYSNSDEDKILYRTGDLAYYNANNDLIYLQRKDFMINVGGYRVEPSEVENALNSLEEVEDSVVAGLDISQITNTEKDIKIYAKVVTNNEINPEKIKKRLLQVLPHYMIPSIIERTKSIPLNINGKIDRKNVVPKNADDIKKLLSMEFNANEIVSPTTDVEKKVFEFCSEILGYDNFGVTNDLLSIGFTSVYLVKLLSKIFNEYQVSISSNDLIDYEATIQDISNMISDSQKIKPVKNKIKEKYSLPYNLHLYYNLVKNIPPINKNISFCLHFSKDFDVFKLKDALLKTINLNNYIKTSFIIINNKPYQKRNDDYQAEIKIHNKKLTNDIKKGFNKPFDESKPPLFNFELYYDNKEVNLLVSIHHFITDFYSLNIFFNDLINMYFDNPITKKEYDYFDYSVEYHQEFNVKPRLPTTEIIKNLPYLIYISGIPYINLLYMKYKKLLSSKFETKVKKFIIDKKIFHKDYNISDNDLILSSIILSLVKLLNRRNIELNFVYHGRDNLKYLETFGHLARVFPLFLTINVNDPIEKYFNYIKKVKDYCVESSVGLLNNLQEYMNESGYSYLEHLKKINYGLLFNKPDVNILYSYFASWDTEDKYYQMEDLGFKDENEQNILYLNVYNHSDNCLLKIKYNSSYYNDEEINGLGNNIEFLLRKLTIDQSEKLKDILN